VIKAASFCVEVSGRRSRWYSFRRFALEPAGEEGKSIPGPRIRDGSAALVGALRESVMVVMSGAISEERRGGSVWSGGSSLRGKVSSCGRSSSLFTGLVLDRPRRRVNPRTLHAVMTIATRNPNTTINACLQESGYQRQRQS